MTNCPLPPPCSNDCAQQQAKKMGKPRFIAGAVCPHCRAVDRVRLTDSGRECVACGTVDEAPRLADQNVPVSTRIDRSRAPAADNMETERAAQAVQVVNVIDPERPAEVTPTLDRSPSPGRDEK